jgi:hypothetical protein
MREPHLLRFLAAVLAVAGASSAGCSKPRVDAHPSASTSASTSAGLDDCEGIFAAPANTVALCDEHVLGNGAEIHWRSYASTESRAAVNARYRVASANCPYELTFKPPAFGIASGGRRLATYEAAEPEYPKCARTPGAAHKTVILVSEKFDRP